MTAASNRTLRPAIVALAAGLGLLALQAQAGAAVAVGEPAPPFALTDIDGQVVRLEDYRGKYVVLEWFNHGCPFVRKHYSTANMQGLQRIYTQKGVVWLAVNSTRKDHQDYRSPEETRADVQTHDAAASHFLLDADGAVGRGYGAKTTPHLFVIDPEGKVVYQGAIDSIRSADAGDVPEAENYLSRALDEALAGAQVSLAETQPYGCSVKYP